MSKLIGEAGEKRAQQSKLIVEGWNGGLTGGELAALHKVTRSAIMGIIYRERNRGVRVEERSRLVMKARIAKLQAKHAGLGSVSGFPDTRRHKPEPSMPPIVLKPDRATDGIAQGSVRKVTTVRKLPPAPIVVKALDLAAPGGDYTAIGVPFMDLQNNAGCRYTLDAKLFCNSPGFPYCPEHKAIVNPPSAQNYYGGRSAGNAQKFT